MSNYALYKQEKKLTSKEMVSAVKKDFPAYSKIQNSMIMYPEKYGLCLVPEAEQSLVNVFGGGPGLESAENAKISEDSATENRRRPNRRKPNRLVVYLGDELNNRVRDLMFRLRYNTVQDFLEAALSSMVSQEMEV